MSSSPANGGFTEGSECLSLNRPHARGVKPQTLRTLRTPEPPPVLGTRAAERIRQRLEELADIADVMRTPPKPSRRGEDEPTEGNPA